MLFRRDLNSLQSKFGNCSRKDYCAEAPQFCTSHPVYTELVEVWPSLEKVGTVWCKKSKAF